MVYQRTFPFKIFALWVPSGSTQRAVEIRPTDLVGEAKIKTLKGALSLKDLKGNGAPKLEEIVELAFPRFGGKEGVYSLLRQG